MSVSLAETVATLLIGYLLAGAGFACAFVVRGVGRIDPDARQMPLAARLLIFPGVAVLWPLMLYKWFAQKAPPAS